MAVILALLCSCIILQASSAIEYYVRPNISSVNCPANSELCLTLDEYAGDTDRYFTSNARFLFLEGEHYMNDAPVLASVTNISLTGVNANVAIVVTEDNGFSVLDSVEVLLASLQFIQTKNVSQFLLLVNNTNMMEIANVMFKMNDYSQAIYFSVSTASVTNCSFYNGYAGSHRGAILSISSSISFLGANIFKNNRADSYGGAIAFSYSSVTFNSNSTFQNNTAGIEVGDDALGGGAVSVIYSNVSFSGASIFNNNTARHHGGAIKAFSSSVTFSEENTFLDNKVLFADYISEYAFSSVIKSTVESTGIGGAIYSHNSTLELHNCTHLEGNMAETGGGIVSQVGSVILGGTTKIFLNKVLSGDGGGVYLFNFTLYYQGDISFTSNIAGRRGAGIFLYQSTVEFQENVKFDNNSAMQLETFRTFLHSDGGGVYICI